jgi:hypothetical protein
MIKRQPPGDMAFTLESLLAAYQQYRLIHYHPLDTQVYKNQFANESFRLLTADELNKVKEKPFSVMLSEFIQKRFDKDADFYNGIEMSRQLFSKIINQPDYQPTRETVMKCCIGLKLGERDAQLLMMSAGYAFSSALDLDLIVKMCLAKRCYQPLLIDQLLEKHKIKPLFATE